MVYRMKVNGKKVGQCKDCLCWEEHYLSRKEVEEEIQRLLEQGGRAKIVIQPVELRLMETRLMRR